MVAIAKCKLGRSRSEVEMGGEANRGWTARQGVRERRLIRSRYLAMRNEINGEIKDISCVDSDGFESIIGQVTKLHDLVQKPREQVADATVLLDIATKLATTVKAHANESVTPTDFISSLLGTYKQQGTAALASWERTSRNISWAEIGMAVSHVFRKASGCCTMIGPMKIEMKRRKVAVHRRRSTPTKSTRPEKVDDDGVEKTDTDKNMAAMFDILREKGHATLENLVPNRSSFAQTVENMFALSFLAKDGRVEITVNENGHHLVLPRNAPPASAVISGEVSYRHFIFRFDYNDWKLMIETIKAGEELMPHRNMQNMSGNSQAAQLPSGSQEAAGKMSAVMKLSRNRGLLVQEECDFRG